MELDMAEVLLNGLPIDYKLVSLRLQLKDGGIEIGPPKSSIKEDDDGVASLVLQVRNEYAEEVEIEYQPFSKQDDSRWGFWCDGRTLKTVIPYKFWKTYWYPDLVGHQFGKDPHPLQLHNLVRRSAATPISSSQASICGVNECSINGENTEPSLSSEKSTSSFLMAGINICQCHSENTNNHNIGANNKGTRQGNSRKVLTALQPMSVGGMIQSGSARAGSGIWEFTYSSSSSFKSVEINRDTRVIKVRCQRPPGSPSSSSSEDFELAIKVRCSRPVSPNEVPEAETKLKCSRPPSPAQVSETTTKTRPHLSTEASETETTIKTEQLSSTEASETTIKTEQLSSTKASETPTKTRRLSYTESFETFTHTRQLSSAEASETTTTTKARKPFETFTQTRQLSSAEASETTTTTKARKYIPTEDFGRTTKARHLSSTETSERMCESRCTTPSSTTEALARAKEALARIQHTSENVVKSGPGSSIDSFDRFSESRCPTPFLHSEALARAKDALARVHPSRPLRPTPSTPRPALSTPRPAPTAFKMKVPSRSQANTEVYVRVVTDPTAVSPRPLTPPSPEKSNLIDFSVLRKSFSGDTSDLIDTFSRAAADIALEQHRDSVVVGQVTVKHLQKLDTKDVWKTAFLDTRELWKAAFEKFISKERANIIKHREMLDKFLSKERANIIKHHRKSKVFFTETFGFISREKTAILKQGKKYIAATRKELASTRIECTFCLGIAPPVLDADNNVNWKSLNDVKSWTNTQIESAQSKSSLVTTGTNTVASTQNSVDGQSQTRF